MAEKIENPDWIIKVLKKIFGKNAIPSSAVPYYLRNYNWNLGTVPGSVPGMPVDTRGWNAIANPQPYAVTSQAPSYGQGWNAIANPPMTTPATNWGQVYENAATPRVNAPTNYQEPAPADTTAGINDWYFGKWGPESPYTEHGGSIENWNTPGEFAGWRANTGEVPENYLGTWNNSITGEPDYYLTSTGSERSRWGSPAYMGAPYLNSGMQKKSYSGPPQGPAGAWISKLSDEDKLAMGWKKINDTTWSGTWSKPKRIEMEAWDSPSAKRRRKKNAPIMPTKTAPVGYGTQGAAGGPAAGWRV